MTATVLIEEYNGTSGVQVGTDQTSANIRFKTADNSSGSSTNNPISIPAAGSNWSFQKFVQLKVTVAPATQISNINVYSSGSIGWTGCNFWAKNVAAYATPALETASTGYTNMNSYTSGSPLSLSVHSAGPYSGTGAIGDFMQSALEVTSSASNGALTATTITVTYLEI